MKITVLGCGRWGSFLAWYQNKIGNTTTLWGRPGSKSFETLINSRKNEYVELESKITLQSDLDLAIRDADVIIISISSQSLRGFIKTLVAKNIENRKIVLCMKGLEQSSGKRLSQICVEEGINPADLAVWVGPGHIQDFVSGIPNCMIIDSQNTDLIKHLADSFSSDLIRFYYGSDLIGSEIGSASKNVMGIAAGMLDGVNMTSLKGPLMCRGSREIARLIKAMGGNELSAYGLCHLGDYETTLFSPHSNNRNFGEKYVQGIPFEKLCEGIYTSGALIELGKIYNVDLPITLTVYNIVVKGNDYKTELTNLFERIQKNEFYI